MADMLKSVYEREQPDPGSVKTLRRPREAAVGAINLLPAVRSQIIPRLHAVLRASLSEPGCVAVAAAPVASDVAVLAEALLAGDDRAIRDHIDRLRDAGTTLETIYLELLAPTGCHLRDLWKDDLCNLADVTLALCALRSVLLHYAADFHAEQPARCVGLRALMVSPSRPTLDLGLPTFGLVLMSEFFRRDGWETWIERDLGSTDFHATVLAEWFDLVEILATDDDQLDAISSGIRSIRRGSPNASIGIIVCGQIFLERPDYARLVGADRVATDPRSSLAQATNFLVNSAPRKRLS